MRQTKRPPEGGLSAAALIEAENQATRTPPPAGVNLRGASSCCEVKRLVPREKPNKRCPLGALRAPQLLRLPEVPAEKFYSYQRADEEGSEQVASADGRSRQSPFVMSRVTQQKSDHERRNAGTNYKADLPNVHANLITSFSLCLPPQPVSE